MAGKKILLVDDSQTVLMMEKMILRRTAYQLLTASDGVEAVQTAIRELPDLILMDVVMPKMNGFEAVKQIRATAETKDIPIIMVTSRGEEENVRTGFESGCNEYVTKPINTLELLCKIQILLGE